VAALGTLAVMLDSAVNIAFPAISAAFDVPATSIQWIVLTYLVAFSLALLPAGRLADRAGPAQACRAGLWVTGAAHLLCGLAPAWSGLLAARVLQGLGAALIMASAPALVTLTAPADRRGRALGRLGLATSLGGVIGPLAGGALVGLVGWPVVYLGRVPLSVAALLLARGPGAVTAAPPHDPPMPTDRSTGDSPSRTEAGGAASGASTVARPGRARPAPGAAARVRAVADLRAFACANGANLLANAGWFAVWLLVPYYLIDRRGFSPGVAGVLFTAGALAGAAATPLGGRLADRGPGRLLAPLALALEGIGLWLTGRLGDGTGATAIVAALALGGFGYGLFLVPNMHYVMSALPRARQGAAASLLALMRTGGIVVGANVTTAVYAARLVAHGREGLAPTAAGSLAFRDALAVAAAVAGLAALLSLVGPRGRRAP
jgi:MFS family permease